ncbi:MULTISPECIES: tellurite resistance TerB family protein [Shewanella]|uniref:TerB family tellurite resistance protein n=1 Tax=Shewanella fidelis TaxID=173509 RepID=A0AAW8NSN7_9GAMM|nr:MULTISPECIES: TerB family tellurite resistance protein [Shewanella]MDR8525576.1 TerB family tellurite resistance protein [Shewanella fidelis]MDW4813105.1 TerB family tellurite resistance protein [Shewanella fidelis]MDW4817015.1 TerB family tellurite resistance protein [Shewanella fidelis]MDW4820174.1 TerB family tellurite resistance protein [Shewanella fidelis]MDW4825570.1 TerB family tellurite resistance protein [Shewanella fidelis]
MLAKLKQFFGNPETPLSDEERAEHLNLAAASLLIEVVMADENMSEKEAELLPTLLTTTLNLDSADVQNLISDAKKSQQKSTSLYEFTQAINDNFNIDQKQQLILAMWQLAYADGHLCQYEDQIIRRTAELFYLRHSELIQMRNIAMEQNQQNES